METAEPNLLPPQGSDPSGTRESGERERKTESEREREREGNTTPIRGIEGDKISDNLPVADAKNACKSPVIIGSEAVAERIPVPPLDSFGVLDSDDEEDAPLMICRKVPGKKKRAMIIEDDDDEDDLTAGRSQDLTSATDTDARGRPLRRSDRKRGKEHVETDTEREMEEEESNRKKTVKAKKMDPAKDEKDKDRTQRREDRERRKDKIKEEEKEEEGEEVLPGVFPPEIESMSTTCLANTAVEWVDEMEECRKKSKKLQGAISGVLRRNLINAREAIMALMVRAQTSGDTWFFRMENKRQSADILELKGKIERLRMQIKRDSPCKEIPPRKRRVTTAEKLVVTPDVSQYVDLRDTMEPSLPQRPPLKGVSKPIPTPTVMREDERDAEISRQIDALVARRAEITKRKREKERSKDWGREESEGTGWSVTESEGGEGNRPRGKPKIISDVQLVPPSHRTRDPRGGHTTEASDAEWRVVRGGRRRYRVRTTTKTALPAASRTEGTTGSAQTRQPDKWL